MSRGIGYEVMEDWIQFIDAETYDDSPEVVSNTVIIFPGCKQQSTGNKIWGRMGAGCYGAEVRLIITGTGAQTKILNIYGCPDGDDTLQNSAPATFAGATTAMTYTLAAAATTRWSKMILGQDVGSGFAIGFTAGGVETHTVSGWYRRFTLGNPSTR